MNKPSDFEGLGTYAGLFWRIHRFEKAGDFHKGHKHHVDHCTLVSQGSVRCVFGDSNEVREYTAPAIIEIDKNIQHQFTALEDDTVYFCVFSYGNHVSPEEAESMMAGLCGSCTICKGE